MKEHIGDELLMKYLAGEASAAEQQQVHAWADASAENAGHLSRLQTIWTESSRIAATSTVDENAAWERFRSRTVQPRRIPLGWMKIAAALLLLAGGAALTYMTLHHAQPKEVVKAEPAPVNKIYTGTTGAASVAPAKTEEPAGATVQPVKEQRIAKVAIKPKKFLKNNYKVSFNSYKRTNDFICNATPCPLEICIIQNIKCSDGGYTTESTCSRLEPDESGQLRYKAMDRITRNCIATIQEIRITQVNTGETIVLNDESKTSAQDFFKYITGQKKGNLLAGMFHTNCDNQADNCGLSIDKHGQLIMH